MENEELGTVIIERPMTKEEKAERAAWAKGETERQKVAATEARYAAYVRISDPVYMQYARGLKTKEEWLAAVAEVEAAYPIPGEGE